MKLFRLVLNKRPSRFNRKLSSFIEIWGRNCTIKQIVIVNSPLYSKVCDLKLPEILINDGIKYAASCKN